jgi:hypothetical protein
VQNDRPKDRLDDSVPTYGWRRRHDEVDDCAAVVNAVPRAWRHDQRLVRAQEMLDALDFGRQLAGEDEEELRRPRVMVPEFARPRRHALEHCRHVVTLEVAPAVAPRVVRGVDA